MELSQPQISTAPVADYVFLSDPESAEVFIIERSGRVRRYLEGEAPASPARRRTAELPVLRQLSGTGNWRWRDGYLPILETADGALAADGDRLLTDRDPEFAAAERKIRARWEKFFAAGRQLSGLPPEMTAAWKSCWVQSLAAFIGRHPRYGVETYGDFRSDGFPPTILAMGDALRQFGYLAMARDFTAYWFERFIRADGSIDYYGPAISEYGQLLQLAADLAEGSEGEDFMRQILPQAIAVTRFLIDQVNPWFHGSRSPYMLTAGCPEADTRDEPDEYLHNNLWALRGMLAAAGALARLKPEFAAETRRVAEVLRRRIDRFIADRLREDPLLPYRLRQSGPVGSFTESMDAAYANYRYYPEMLSSGLLPREAAYAIIAAREERGGELDGATLFGWSEFPLSVDDWPIDDYARGLAMLGDADRLAKVIQGHFRHAMSPDTFTAYEAVLCGGEPRRACTDWCVPAQLALPRMLARLADLESSAANRRQN